MGEFGDDLLTKGITTGLYHGVIKPGAWVIKETPRLAGAIWNKGKYALPWVWDALNTASEYSDNRELGMPHEEALPRAVGVGVAGALANFHDPFAIADIAPHLMQWGLKKTTPKIGETYPSGSGLFVSGLGVTNPVLGTIDKDLAKRQLKNRERLNSVIPGVFSYLSPEMIMRKTQDYFSGNKNLPSNYMLRNASILAQNSLQKHYKRFTEAGYPHDEALHAAKQWTQKDLDAQEGRLIEYPIK